MSFQKQKIELSPTPQKTNIWKKVFFVLVFITVCFIGFKVYPIITFLTTPGSKKGVDIEVAIPPGVSFHIVAEYLKDMHVITDVQKFEAVAKWKGFTNKVKSGRFLINTGWNPLEVLDQLVNGKSILDRVTIPEGLTWWEVGKRLEKAGFVSFEDFKNVVHDPEFLKHWGIPFHNAEGFLFPDTYLMTRPFRQDVESAKVIVGTLIENFWRRTSELWPNDINPRFNNTALIKQPIILASIIEKEAKLESERALVSGVYVNRLSVNMPLQACPTVIYGLGENFSGKLRYSHINDKSNKYNTYRYAGLPPSPIASPGMTSIRAALNPAKHSYYYFLARGDGSHVFSSNFNEHKKMRKMYQSPLRKGDTSSLIHGGMTEPKCIIEEDIQNFQDIKND